MPSTLHQYAIEVLKRRVPNLQTRGFKEFIRNHPDYLRETESWLNIIPDAFSIREQVVNGQRYGDIITIYEVEVGNPINDEKMQRIVHLWEALDSCMICLELCVVDKFGKITNKITEVEMERMSLMPKWR